MTSAPTVFPRLSAALEGRYRIERELGAGGMATVYLAEDVRHRRRVALKLLHAELSAVLGPERFLKEIELTASLQHPHILPLFDSGSAEGQLFYVMPFVEGETLRARLERERQLPIPDALGIAREVADALQYAHERGVIHRDIKPENILLQGGHALVADFGIALAVQQAGGHRMTQTGLSLGTPQYMAPEQAMGEKTIDARADVYALGAVTYEMLVGEAPFTGPTAQAIVAKVLTADPPPLTVLRRNVPPHVAEAVHRAIEKLPADRHARASDFAAELGGTAVAGHATTRTTAARPATTRRTTLLLATTTGLAVVASAAAVWALRRPVPERPLAIFTIGLPDSAQLSEYTQGRRVAISRDGSRIAFPAGDGVVPELYVRALSDTLPRLVRGSTLAAEPVFSPDNQWLYYNSQQKVMRIPVEGGTPVVVAESATVGDVNARNEVLVRRGQAIVLIDASGERLLARTDTTRGEVSISNPRFGADGKSVLANVLVNGRGALGGTVVRFGLPDGRRTPLGLEGRLIAEASGHLVIVRDGGVWAAPYSDGKVTGGLVQVVGLVAARSFGVDASVSAEGTLVYVTGSSGTSYRLVRVDVKGVERVLDNEPQRYSWPRLSPDGRRVAVEVGAAGAGFDLWLHDIGDRTLTRLTTNFTGVRPAGWSTDGRRIAYFAVQGGGTPTMRRTVAWIPWDLSGPPELLPVEASAGVEDVSIGPSREVMAVRLKGYSAPGDIFVAPLDSPRVARPFVATSADEETPRLSPNGRWLAYSSDETGRYEVYVRPVSAPGGRVQVSAGGGSEPVWARDGRSLFYRGNTHLMRASVGGESELAVQKRDTLFPDDRYRKELRAVLYDVFPDGQTLLMLKQAGRSSREPTVVFNWPELVRRPAGVRR